MKPIHNNKTIAAAKPAVANNPNLEKMKPIHNKAVSI